ncbi:hypothetical protein H8F21_13310 [Pseudomonas sp. P66]|uniref:Uncharacterized protein n=2 Tax=Pseudomonas arcuscaelestis TaxID=2710591 RepID=A0ABS2BZW8_9PSED|nr:hypothetical protein [Pseudomonas arcuscaelestis]MBM5458541.1 hypothetical protein [Pseudomonas arcuscaelestis]
MIMYKFHHSAVLDVRNLPTPSDRTRDPSIYPTSGISDLPGVLASATSWLVCETLWPYRVEAESLTAEIHFSVHSDHSFATIDDLTGDLREHGIFAATLYAQKPGPLSWLRPHSSFSVEYTGLRWVVPRDSLAQEIERIAHELAGQPGQLVPIG